MVQAVTLDSLFIKKEKKEIAWLITGNPLFLRPYFVGFRNLKESLLGAIPVSIQHYTITIYYKKKNNPDSVLEMNKKKKNRIIFIISIYARQLVR